MTTVLIVDDAHESCAALELALEDAAAVVTATSAEAALQRLTGDKIAAVITDVQLPAMDGWQLVQAIRGDARWSTLPVIVVSASADPDAPAKARSAGANAYFSKPFSPLAIRQRLKELLEESIHARS